MEHRLDLDKTINWDKLDITNDFVFTKFMSDPEICKEVLGILLGFEIGEIEKVEYQNTIEIDLSQKGVRLDVYVKDSDKIYDIEMQVTNSPSLIKRARYYQSCIDIDDLEKGMSYGNLRDSYIIFICTFDPFELDLPTYSFENVCKEDNNLKLNDGRHILFFNTKAYLKEENTNIKNFLAFVKGEKVEDGTIEKFKSQIKRIILNPKWRKDYMNLALVMNEREESGIKKGIEIGREEGREEGILKKACAVAKETYAMGLDIEQIIRISGLSKEELENIGIV